MKIVEVSPSNLGGGRRGWGGPIFFLEDNLAFQNITKFQPSSSKRLEIIPYLNLGTDDTHPRRTIVVDTKITLISSDCHEVSFS